MNRTRYQISYIAYALFYVKLKYTHARTGENKETQITKSKHEL